MRACDVPPNLLNRLIFDKLLNHPLPWTPEQDWTIEVTDAKGRIVLKCINYAEANELIDLATQLDKELRDTRAEMEAEIMRESEP